MRYKELDALRGIAALLVVFFHFTLEQPQAQLGFRFGVTGVDLFFILSGFVIFMSINKVSSTSEFIINRVSRLYPTYWACVTFTFIVQLCTKRFQAHPQNFTFIQYLGNITMFQHYFKIQDIDGPYWTMIIEMVFYISIAVLFSVKKLKYIIPISIAALCIVIINYCWVINKYPGLYDSINFIFPLIGHFPLFFAGILFYKILNDNNNASQKIFYYICLLICFLTQAMLFEKAGRAQLFITTTEYIYILGAYFFVFILFVNKRLRFIVSRPTLFLGKISFALYLVHQYISVNVIIAALHKHLHINFWLSAFVALITVISIATVITFYIELPFGKKMNNFLRDKFRLQKRTAALG